MFYWLADLLYDPEGALSFLRLISYLSVRAILAFITAFGFSLIFGRRIILWLMRRGARETIRDYSDFLHEAKKGTPTMGGILLFLSIAIPALLWCNLSNKFIILVVGATFWFFLIGCWDDLQKLQGKDSDKGLSRIEKLLLQGLFGVIVGYLLFFTSWTPFPADIANAIFIPFMKAPILQLSWVTFLFVVFVILSISNAVNFADGLDGLAVVPASVVAGVYGIFAYVLGNTILSEYLLYPYIPGSGEMTVFCAAVMGGGLGFLWFNAYPAQVFMGDSGSIMLGGVLATMAVLLKQEFLFLIVGGIFLAEACSVLIQDRLGIARLGRRIFFRAPLHHSFQYRGMPETTVVVRFWIVSILLALIGLMTLKIR
jgi:phospho-N-acetylmuramoyl-pentapeptide-transferase